MAVDLMGILRRQIRNKMPWKEKPVFDQRIPVKVNRHYDIPFKASSREGIYIFDVETIQDRDSNDDIITDVYDEENYQTLISNDRAFKAGASKNLLPTPATIIHAKAYWNTKLYFRPKLNEQYYLVLDNSHSVNKDKDVKVRIFFKPEYLDAVNLVEEYLLENRWDDLWEMLKKAHSLSYDGDNASSCENLRKSLILLWTRVCEKIDGKPLTIEEGKGINTKALEEVLKTNNIDEHVVSFITRTWSFVSELAHIEKRGGQQPSPEVTQLATNSTLGVFGYLLSLLKNN